MSLITEKTQHLNALLEPIVGKITVKNYFSYCGIFKDELMFGLYKDGNFYLRIPAQHLEQALSYQGVQVLDDPKVSHTKKYYRLTDEIMSNLSSYISWFTSSLSEIKENKYISYYAKRQTIRSLPNMTCYLERLLRKINIYTIEDFLNKGEISIFIDLLKLGLDVNHNTFFKLYGAIHHQFIYSIPDHIKRDLLHEIDEALYNAGLRKRFTKMYS